MAVRNVKLVRTDNSILMSILVKLKVIAIQADLVGYCRSYNYKWMGKRSHSCGVLYRIQLFEGGVVVIFFLVAPLRHQ